MTTLRLMRKIRRDKRKGMNGGFTLTEMLMTMLILVIASTLLATGIPVAIDTYQKTVKCANAQVALSTTISALKSELTLASDVSVKDNKICYVSREEGCSIYMENTEDAEVCRGLEKQYYKGVFTKDDDIDTDLNDGEPIPLISNATVTDELVVKYDSATKPEDGDAITLNRLRVEDNDGNDLAIIESYEILTRFEN